MSTTAPVLPDSIAAEIGALPDRLFLGGSFVDAADGGALAFEDPGSGQAVGSVADATVDDALAALDAADAAQDAWAQTTPRHRAGVVGRLFDLIVERREQFARLLTIEMGRPLEQSFGEVDYGADFVRWYAEEAVRVNGRTSVAPSGGSRIRTHHRPVGPCLLITPWNFPLAMVTRKVAPALAAGCTAIVKPAEQTPYSALLLARLAREAGVPAGVLSVLPTSRSGEISAALMNDSRLRKVSFTGSTAVGRQLVRQGAENLLRMSMELGGNAALVVFEDADVDAAVEGAMLAKLRNMGESCTAANRLLVHESVVAEFTEKVRAAMAAMPVGHGLDPATEVGPLIDARQLARVKGLVGAAVAAGAELVASEVEIPESGHFLAPSLLVDVDADAAINQAEIFGPIAPVVTFADEDEAIALANGTPYGLATFVFTEGVRRSQRVCERLESGMIGLNRGVVSNAAAPFGGVKHSGFGREGGPEGLAEYLSAVYVAVDA